MKLAIKFITNLLIISNINILDYFLLFLNIMLFSFLKHLALKVNINYLVKTYQFSEVLQDLSIFFIKYIDKIDLYINNFIQYFYLVYKNFKKKN